MILEQISDDTPFHVVRDLAVMVKEFKLTQDTQDHLVDDLMVYIDWVISELSKGVEFYVIRGKGYIVAEPYHDILKKPEFARCIMLTSVYVRPLFRNTRVYGILIHGLLRKYSGLRVVGSAMIGSTHSKVLDRRFKKIANVYVANINKEDLCQRL